MANEVIAIGSGCIDHLSIVEHTPEGWELCGVPLVQGGGLASTGATAIARLGGRVELWGIVGDDYHGQMIRTELERDGVDISQMPTIPGHRSPCSYIEVDSETGERTIYGSGFDRRPDNLDVYFDPTRARQVKSMLVTGFVPDTAIAAARELHAVGGKVVADMARLGGPVAELQHHVDALIMPEFAVEPIVGSFDIPRALAVLADLGGTMPMFTVGPQGSYYLAEGVVYHCPAFKIKAVDTTGCGDSFHGAFAFALARGMNQHEAVRFSSAVAGLKATKLGGRSGLPTLEAVQQFMADRPDEARARKHADGTLA